MKHNILRLVMAMLSLFVASASFANSLQKIMIGNLYYTLDEVRMEATVTHEGDSPYGNKKYELESITIP